mmetsp:Transcript_24832/g.41690  ORF Transcript_24832/g.41690 Transcript_24832/m.41690 type:complete len:236 (-) Transcript_24832:410-1117(-)
MRSRSVTERDGLVVEIGKISVSTEENTTDGVADGDGDEVLVEETSKGCVWGVVHDAEWNEEHVGDAVFCKHKHHRADQRVDHQQLSGNVFRRCDPKDRETDDDVAQDAAQKRRLPRQVRLVGHQLSQDGVLGVGVKRVCKVGEDTSDTHAASAVGKEGDHEDEKTSVDGDCPTEHSDRHGHHVSCEELGTKQDDGHETDGKRGGKEDATEGTGSKEGLGAVGGGSGSVVVGHDDG